MDKATLIRYLADIANDNNEGCWAVLLSLLFSRELTEERKQQALREIEEKIKSCKQTNQKLLEELDELYIELGGNNDSTSCLGEYVGGICVSKWVSIGN